jgi:hypothetical protein
MDLEEYHFRLIPIETLNFIFSYIDIALLVSNRVISRFFRKTIDRIIRVYYRDDFFQYLFRVPNLSVATLQLYLDNVSFSDNNQHEKLAYIILAAFVNKYITFVSEIIKAIVKNSTITLPFDNISDIVNNTFIKQLPMSCADVIDLHEYCRIWIVSALNADRIDIISTMYPDAPIDKDELFQKFAKAFYLSSLDIYYNEDANDRFSKYCIMYAEIYWKHSKKMAYYGKRSLGYRIGIQINHYDMLQDHMRCALYGGNLDIFYWFLENYLPGQHVRDYHKMITICLLRGNHISKYRTYLHTYYKCNSLNKSYITIPMFENSCKLQDKTITIDDIFTNESAGNINLPRLSLETFEFYLQKFNLKGCLPDSDCHIGIASIAIYEKYLTDNKPK